VSAFEFERDIYLEDGSCRIEDRIRGDLKGTTILFAVRSLPAASVHVQGLTRLGSMTGWGSNGSQAIDLYGAPGASGEVRYTCRIEPA
jgi:hypothetical protein